jgi:hypothetical protein
MVRTGLMAALLAALCIAPLALPPAARANDVNTTVSDGGRCADIYVYDLWAAYPGGEWARVGSYFVTVYRDNGYTDWGGLIQGRDAWAAAGCYTWISDGRYWRTTHNG